MVKTRRSDGRVTRDREDVADERTALLSEGQNHSYTQPSSREDVAEDDGFNRMLAQVEPIDTGAGIEPESQETAMLRESRKSISSISTAEQIGADEDNVNGDRQLKSPFLTGISVSRFWLIFMGVLVTYFVACFDSTIMVSSHPVITSYFQSSNSASWLSTAFLLTSTSFQPLFGRLSDTIGRKPPYVFTTVIFLLATLWCALAQSMTSFIAARAVCGLGAGGMMSLGSIITSDLVPIEIRGAYQSYINIVFGLGSATGAAVGGAIADSLGWRWEFGIQIPLLVACLVISLLTIPSTLGLAEGAKQKTLGEAMKVFDFTGSILLTTSITFLILGLNLGGNVYPWSHPFVIVSLVIFAFAFPAFIFAESRAELPIMPLKIIYQNPRAGLIISNSIGAIIVNGIIFNTPLYFQAVLLESATNSGLRLIVPSLAASIMGTATGFLITWTKRLKWLLVLGVGFLLTGTIALSFMVRGLPNWVYLFFLIPSSMGQGFMFPATFMSVLAVSPQSEQAVVTSTLILWRSIGMVLGVALSSLLLQNTLFYYLSQNVTGPEAADVIEQVRKSVQAIKGLDEVYQEMVVDSYASALRATFVGAACLSLITVAITLPLKLPRLGARK